ncbi:MAG: excinuclease ABC subunit UvrA [Lentisphaerae bacterium]|nr:excinuclease ABC subunit UvrA [Lentisphaerota bacterium]
MEPDCIVVAGAREHNLKNVTVRIPRNRLTVITGLSGSGKSSLAFDTIYAEGQRRYVESVSAYARQFLHQMHKPDVDYIEGLSPAISIEQRTAASNPRSIVATATEIHDYLRVLYAHVGKRHCPTCGQPVARQSAEQIVGALMALPARTKLSLLAPLARGRRGSHDELLKAAQKQGFIRVRIDGEMYELESLPEINPKQAHDLDVVVDRLVVSDQIRTRLTDSVELALQRGDGLLSALIQPDGEPAREVIYSEKQACHACGLSFADLSPRSFSFNSPYGACPTCDGLGTQLIMDERLIVPDPTLSLDDGAIQAWRGMGRRLSIYFKQQLRGVAKHAGVSMETPFGELPEEVRRLILWGSGEEVLDFGQWRKGVYRKYQRVFEGVVPNLMRRLQSTESEFMRARLRRYMNRRLCPDCQGARLRPDVLACTIEGVSIMGITDRPVNQALAFFETLALSAQETMIAADVLKEIRRRLHFLNDVGLGYLPLSRESGTLSGGELQRIRLATQIGSGLVGVLYVLDEPTVGLHVRDNERLIGILQQLRDIGNTVIVVEHDAAMIRSADYVIDLGPGAGRHGGDVVAAGTLTDVMATPTSVTAPFLKPAAPHAHVVRHPRTHGSLTIVGATANNLKNIDVEIPLGLLVCVTGVSGSGKSTLVDDVLRRALARHFHDSKEEPGQHRRLLGVEQLDKVIVIDQSPIGRTPRSNPATYTGAFDDIRALFASTPAAKVRGYGVGRFSFNVKGGRCEPCKGDGILRLEMHFLPDVYVPCESCNGKRYNRETLEVHFQGRNIDQVLGMTIDEALDVFGNMPRIARKLRTLSEVGLGYLQLGQSATTLSGGEAQRIKLASELSRQATGRTLYVLDEPTTGLHFADVQRLMVVLQRLRESGNTVVVIEHNLDVIRAADYIIDLGPEGGDAGGRVVATGTPEAVAACGESHTGRYLREVLT